MAGNPSVIFRINNDFKAVVEEAKKHDCEILFVKDNGVYILSEHGEMTLDGKNPRRANIAYAEGLNPSKVDLDDWYEKSSYLCGGDDFAHSFPIVLFQYVIDIGGSIELIVKSEAIELQII